MQRFKVSRQLFVAVRLSPRKGYEVAREAGLHPSVLSRLIHNAEPIRSMDPRVIRIGRVLGLGPEECFESDRRGAERTSGAAHGHGA